MRYIWELFCFSSHSTPQGKACFTLTLSSSQGKIFTLVNIIVVRLQMNDFIFLSTHRVIHTRTLLLDYHCTYNRHNEKFSWIGKGNWNWIRYANTLLSLYIIIHICELIYEIPMVVLVRGELFVKQTFINCNQSVTWRIGSSPIPPEN